MACWDVGWVGRNGWQDPPGLTVPPCSALKCATARTEGTWLLPSMTTNPSPIARPMRACIPAAAAERRAPSGTGWPWSRRWRPPAPVAAPRAR